MEVDFVTLNATIGVLLPPVISLLKRQTWPTNVKKYFAAALAIIAGVVSVGVSEGWAMLDFGLIVSSIAIIYPLVQTTYLGFWEDTAVDEVLTRIGTGD